MNRQHEKAQWNHFQFCFCNSIDWWPDSVFRWETLWLFSHLHVLSQRQNLNVLYSEEHVVASSRMVRARCKCAHRLSLWLPGRSVLPLCFISRDNALNVHLVSSQIENLRGFSPELLTWLNSQADGGDGSGRGTLSCSFVRKKTCLA